MLLVKFSHLTPCDGTASVAAPIICATFFDCFFVRFPLACVHGLALFAAGRVIAVRAVLSALVAIALHFNAANGERRLTFWLHR